MNSEIPDDQTNEDLRQGIYSSRFYSLQYALNCRIEELTTALVEEIMANQPSACPICHGNREAHEMLLRKALGEGWRVAVPAGREGER